jgi:hypothetical protein
MASRDYITPAQLKDENPYLRGHGNHVAKISGSLGFLSLLAAFVIGANQGDQMQRFFYSYHVAFVYTAVISLGALFFIIVFHLTRAQWNVVLRRVAEILATNFWVVAIFAIPSLLGALGVLDLTHIWPWFGDRSHDHLLQHKAPFLNNTFFVLRVLFYLAFWTWTAYYFFRGSVKQDESGDPSITRRFWTFSAPGMLLFALTLTAFVVDMVMSLDPYWFSTIIGVYFFAGCVLTIMSTLVLIMFWLQKNGHLRRAITVEHQHDLGKLMFAFTVFWGYIAFSQYMLYWYANIPEETQWFLRRQEGEWRWFAWGLLFMHLLIPLAGLISRWVKKNRRFIAFWAFWILAMEWYDLYYLIMPNYQKPASSSEFFAATIPFHILDVLCMVGLVGLYVAAAAVRAERVAIIPLKDPAIEESLKFENVKV